MGLTLERGSKKIHCRESKRNLGRTDPNQRSSARKMIQIAWKIEERRTSFSDLRPGHTTLIICRDPGEVAEEAGLG